MAKCFFSGLVFLFSVLPAYAIEEEGFFEQYREKVLPFYQTGIQGVFYGSENKKIKYLKFRSEKKDTAIIILPGKSESYIKYAELIYDLKRPGVSFYLMDHRGMGFSERLLAHNRDKVFVENFDYYVRDLKRFIDKVIVSEKYKNLFLIGHSMAGTIAVLYLEKFPRDLNGAILCSPMIKINTGFLPEKAVHLITGFFISTGMGKHYCISQGKRKFREFKDNPLTSSKNRWDLWEKKILPENPEIISGGATNRWLNESINACQKALDNSFRIRTPVLILKAEKDTVVKPESMDVLCEKTDCEKISFDNARHEILMERDSIRNIALDGIQKFINLHSR